jgi:hypothetical protein
MRTLRLLAFMAMAGALPGYGALAQATTNDSPSAATATTTTLAKEADTRAWSCYASAYLYIVPDSREYVQPTFAANRGGLHLEARYNYENLDTGSLWLGYSFSVGERLTLEFTPMVGGIMGHTVGVAPGYRFTSSYGKLELASEGEYVIDGHDSRENFFYNWSELAVSPLEGFRFGAAVQRTKLYASDFDLQRGFLVGFVYKKVDVTAYVFNPDATRPTVVLAAGLGF